MGINDLVAEKCAVQPLDDHYIPDGYVLLPRAWLDEQLWSRKDDFRVFLYLLMIATHQPEMAAGSVPVPRGAYVYSFRKIQKGTRWVENNALQEYHLSRILQITDRLIAEGWIAKDRTSICTRWQVTGYDIHENPRNYEHPTKRLRAGNDTAILAVKTRHCEQPLNNNKKVYNTRDRDGSSGRWLDEDQLYDEFYDLADVWAATTFLHADLTAPVFKAYCEKRGEWTSKQIEDALFNYDYVMGSPNHFYSHPYSFASFLKSKTTIERFWDTDNLDGFLDLYK